MKLVISAGGSLISKEKGIDYSYIKKFSKKLIELSKEYNLIIFVGGGRTARDYIQAAKKIGISKSNELDEIGIRATLLNAELIRISLGKHAFPEIFSNPKKIPKNFKKIIVCSGWKPGWSTDYDAVLTAKIQKINTVINLTNIDYVYEKDPKKFPNAKPIKKLNWKEMLKLISQSWKPGMNTPFDPLACKLAEKNKIRVVLINGTKLKEVQKYLKGKKFKGTIIN